MSDVGYVDNLMPPLLALLAAPHATLLYPLLISFPEFMTSPWEDLSAKTRLLYALVSLGPALIAVYMLNADLDRSPAVIKSYPIVSRGIGWGKGVHVSYVVDLAADDPLQPPSLSSRGAPARRRQVNCALDEGVYPRSSQLVLRVHSGAFGFGWFEARNCSTK